MNDATSGGGRVALVTGASSGIGAATAVELAERGWTVGLVARRRDRLQQVLDRCLPHAPDSRLWSADLSDPQRAEAVALEAWDALGAIDALVNNAGVPKRKPVQRIRYDEIEDVMRINFLSPVRMTLALLPRMIAHGTGVVVNVSSIAGRFGVATEAAYSASKFALNGWSEGIHADLDGTGVVVRIILPGAIATELWDQPDNDPPLYDGELTPAEDVARGIADAIDSDKIEHYLPDMKAVAEMKTSDLDAFMAGMTAHVRQTRARQAERA